MDAECVAFETDYKGKLAEQTAGEGGGQWLAEAVRRYEAIDDLAGRLGSYAGSGSRRRQRRSRDLQILRRRFRAADECVGASVVLRARTQPRRRRRDRTRDADARARALSPVDRGSAQGQAVSARGSRRAAVSREIAERLRRLEPAVRSDHLGPALQGRGQGTGDRADAEPAAGSRRRKAQGGRAGAGEDVQGQRADLRADHQHARQGQGDFRSLARFCRRRGFAASRTTASSARWSMRWWVRFAPPIRGCRIAIIG